VLAGGIHTVFVAMLAISVASLVLAFQLPSHDLEKRAAEASAAK
jgi:hypothetical protein